MAYYQSCVTKSVRAFVANNLLTPVYGDGLQPAHGFQDNYEHSLFSRLAHEIRNNWESSRFYVVWYAGYYVNSEVFGNIIDAVNFLVVTIRGAQATMMANWQFNETYYDGTDRRQEFRVWYERQARDGRHQCRIPADIIGYDVSGCNTTIWLFEPECVVRCSPFFGVYGSRSSSVIATCPGPNRFFSLSGCSDDFRICERARSNITLAGTMKVLEYDGLATPACQDISPFFLGSFQQVCHSDGTFIAHAYFCGMRLLAVGRHHQCAALALGGIVKCWGQNLQGQLGYGDTLARLTPSDMGDALPNVNLGRDQIALQVIAGANHNCVLLEMHAIKCWGDGSYGKLGYRDLVTRGDGVYEMGDMLPQVGFHNVVKEVAAGNEHTCALFDNGVCKCWGQLLLLGYRVSFAPESAHNCEYIDAISNDVNEELPGVNVGTGRVVAQVVAGDAHTCVRLEIGAAACWGKGSNGELGFHFNEFYEHKGVSCSSLYGFRPHEMGDALPLVHLGAHAKVLLLAAGGSHTCAILANQLAKCWGSGRRGQLGYSNNRDYGSFPGEMGDMLPFLELGDDVAPTQFALGSHHTCALFNGGVVKCWGASICSPSQAEAGCEITDVASGSTAMGDILLAVDVGVGRTVIQIACGSDQACSILNGWDFKCWQVMERRSNGSFEMGDALPFISVVLELLPAKISCVLSTTCVLNISIFGRGQFDNRNQVFIADGNVCHLEDLAKLGNTWKELVGMSTELNSGSPSLQRSAFDLGIPTVLTEVRTFLICFKQHENSMWRAIGRMAFIGPTVEASSCHRGQMCALSLSVPLISSWNDGWPISRVLVGTGNCGFSVSLVYAFPSNVTGGALVATPGVSERYSSAEPGVYHFSGRTGLVEPGTYALCWCVLGAAKSCEEPPDFNTSASIGTLSILGPLTPALWYPCWRGGSCRAYGFGISLDASDLLALCSKPLHITPDGVVRPLPPLLPSKVGPVAQIHVMVPGPVLEDAGSTFTICWCPTNQCNEKSVAEAFGAQIAVLKVFGPKKEGALGTQCYAAFACNLNISGLPHVGDRVELNVSSSQIVLKHESGTGLFPCINATTIPGVSSAELTSAWPQRFRLSYLTNQSAFRGTAWKSTFTICWCHALEDGLKAQIAGCDTPTRFAVDAGQLELLGYCSSGRYYVPGMGCTPCGQYSAQKVFYCIGHRNGVLANPSRCPDNSGIEPKIDTPSEVFACACFPGFEVRDLHSTSSFICSQCNFSHHKNLSGNWLCSLCHHGSTSVQGKGQTCSCLPGREYSARDSACNVCSIGKYNSTGGNCLVCDPGKFTNKTGSLRCSRCERGYYSHIDLIACLACSTGKFAESRVSSMCTSCPAGFYSDKTASTKCERCEIGRYAQHQGAHVCNACSQSRTTLYKGSSNARDDCVCHSNQIEINASGVLQCEVCQFGLECPTGSTLLTLMNLSDNEVLESFNMVGMDSASTLPRLLPGYMSFMESPLFVWRCTNTKICPGGLPGSCATYRDDTTRACSSCLSGYHPWDDQCFKCGDNFWLNIAVIIVLIITMGGTLYLMVKYVNMEQARMRKAVSSACSIAGLLWTALQCTAVLGKSALTWGSPLSSFIDTSDIMAFDMDLIGWKCIFDKGPTAGFVCRLLPLPLVVISAGVALAIRHARARWEGRFCGGALGQMFSVMGRSHNQEASLSGKVLRRAHS